MTRPTPLLAVWLLGCGSPSLGPLEKVAGPPPVVDSGTPDSPAFIGDRPELRDPLRFFRRASLDLTGHLPSPAQLDALHADPTTLDAHLADLHAHAGLEERMVHVLDEQWHLRFEALPVGPSDYGFDPELRYALARNMGEEPLRMMARVVSDDRSWDTIVQTDTTMATPLLTRVWPMEPVGVPEGEWAPTRWTDHRPAVGVLASNGFWWRYDTTAFNYNRTRAAAIARLVLCNDYLEFDIEFESPSLTDAEGTEEAIRTNASCVACHQTLDPLSSLFFGFWAYDLYDPLELSRYHPEREPLGPEYLQVDPAWFGTPVNSLSDLATVVPADRRFPACAVQTFSTAMWRRPTTEDDSTVQESLLAEFEANDRRVWSLLMALTRTRAYVGDLAAEPPDDARPRLLGPQQLARVLDQTLGFDWHHNGENQLDNDLTGLRVTLGGVDGEEVTAPKASPDANLALAWRAVSQAAGRHALDTLNTGDNPLLPGVTTDSTPDDPAFRDALAHAWLWLTATEATSQQLDDLTELWRVAGATHPREGWVAVVSALLQDPLVVTY